MRKVKIELFAQMKATVLVSSDWFLRLVKELDIFKKADIRILPFGLDLELFKPIDKNMAKSRLGISQNDLVISFRNMPSNPFKNTEVIYRALEGIDNMSSITLLVVGDSLTRPSVMKKYRIRELGNITEPSQMVDFYNATDIFLMPSRNETFGLMIAEAMACGVPSIVADNTPLPWVADSPNSSLNIPQDDSDALKAALWRLCKNSGLRAEMGLRARGIAEERYDFKTYVGNLTSIYEQAIDRFASNVAPTSGEHVYPRKPAVPSSIPPFPAEKGRQPQ